MDKSTTQNAHLITVEEVIKDLRNGWISASAAIRYYILIECSPSEEIAIHPNFICDRLGVSKASFYRAIAKMVEEGEVNPPQFERGLAIRRSNDGEKLEITKSTDVIISRNQRK